MIKKKSLRVSRQGEDVITTKYGRNKKHSFVIFPVISSQEFFDFQASFFWNMVFIRFEIDL